MKSVIVALMMVFGVVTSAVAQSDSQIRTLHEQSGWSLLLSANPSPSCGLFTDKHVSSNLDWFAVQMWPGERYVELKVFNDNWSMEKGKNYEVQVVFDNEQVWDGEAWTGENLFSIPIRTTMFEDLKSHYEMKIIYNDKKVGSVRLHNTVKLVPLLNECYVTLKDKMKQKRANPFN